jgi:hypothetical protein
MCARQLSTNHTHTNIFQNSIIAAPYFLWRGFFVRTAAGNFIHRKVGNDESAQKSCRKDVARNAFTAGRRLCCRPISTSCRAPIPTEAHEERGSGRISSLTTAPACPLAKGDGKEWRYGGMLPAEPAPSIVERLGMTARWRMLRRIPNGAIRNSTE